MEFISLKTTFFALLERVDQYYDNKLMQELKARANLENYKDDLIQELGFQVWANYNRETYKSYHPEAYIWLKAEKVWITFVRKLNRQTIHKSNILIEDLPENYATTNFLQEFENRDTVAMIESLLSQDEIDLLQFRAQGFTYKQIKELSNYSSEDAAKTKFNRIKKFIRVRFRRP